MSELRWEIEASEANDRLLRERCAAALGRLAALDRPAALERLADPRSLHADLYRGLTPPMHPEVAGNFRGSDFDSLRQSIVFFAFTPQEGTKGIAGPEQVASLMADYASLLRLHGHRRPQSIDEALRIYVPFMIFFGLVHPFLNGNGHVQRLTLQHLVERAGFRMTPSWSIHPRSYGEAMDRALAGRDGFGVITLLSPFVTI